ncbi:MAG: hypothetical protein AAB092_06765 [Chloroflexota bacterium]
MKELNYAMQFKGNAKPVDPADPSVLNIRGTAQSTVIRSAVGANGLSTNLQGAAGSFAKFCSQLKMTGKSVFQEDGTITFGEGNSVRFVTVQEGHVERSGEPGLMAGAVVWRVEGGEGQFAGASGFITSNFYFNQAGEVTDNQFGVIFVP